MRILNSWKNTIQWLNMDLLMWSPTCLPLLIITMQELRMAENIITTTFNSVTQQ